MADEWGFDPWEGNHLVVFDARLAVVECQILVECQICGTPTQMTGTKRCDRCWELEQRITADPGLARIILARLGD